jgi:hypothetical protein
MPLPVGLIYDAVGHVIDPDTAIQGALRHLFTTFEATGSATACVKAFNSAGLLFPWRHQKGPRKGETDWKPLAHHAVLRVLHNPRYAGCFTYGRHRYQTLPAGQGGTQIRRLRHAGTRPATGDWRPPPGPWHPRPHTASRPAHTPCAWRRTLPGHGRRSGLTAGIQHQHPAIGDPDEEIRSVPADLPARRPPQQPERLGDHRGHRRIEVQRDQVSRSTHDSNPTRRPIVADQYQPG